MPDMAQRRGVDLALAVADGADLNVPFAAQAGKEQAIRVANRQLGEVNAMGLRCRIAHVRQQFLGQRQAIHQPIYRRRQQAIVRQRIDCCRLPQRPWRAACFQMFLPLPLVILTTHPPDTAENRLLNLARPAVSMLNAHGNFAFAK